MPQATAMPPDPVPTVQQLLAFYLEAGVDCALGDEPVNRLADQETAPQPRAAVAHQPMPRAAPLPPPAAKPRADATVAPDVAINSAREAARTAPTLEALRQLLENFDGCALRHTATRLVFSVGNRCKPSACARPRRATA